MTRKRPTAAVLLAPGAGSDRTHSTLVALEHGLAPIPVERMDFAYRTAGRKAPDRAPVLLAAVREAVGELMTRTGLSADRLILGGRSMGGRICSMVVAEGAVSETTGAADSATPIGAGLILISYPLHPPGRPERLRIEHFPDISVPCLFISGDRDPFGTPAELEAHTGAIAGPVTHHWIAKGRHDLKGVDDEICEVTRAWLRSID